MDEIEVYEVIVIARFKRERWVAESYWYRAVGAAMLLETMALMQDSWVQTSLPFVDRNKNWKITVKCQHHKLTGPLAAKMRHHLNDVGGGRKPAWSWCRADSVQISLLEEQQHGS